MRFKVLAGFAAGMFMFATVQAQQATGNIMGDAKTGDTIVAESPDIGFHREITVEKDGRYTLRRVPIGSYAITVRHADGTAEPRKAIRVQAGTTARVK